MIRARFLVNASLAAAIASAAFDIFESFRAAVMHFTEIMTNSRYSTIIVVAYDSNDRRLR
jgi:hypothetical protein